MGSGKSKLDEGAKIGGIGRAFNNDVVDDHGMESLYQAFKNGIPLDVKINGKNMKVEVMLSKFSPSSHWFDPFRGVESEAEERECFSQFVKKFNGRSPFDIVKEMSKGLGDMEFDKLRLNFGPNGFQFSLSNMYTVPNQPRTAKSALFVQDFYYGKFSGMKSYLDFFVVPDALQGQKGIAKIMMENSIKLHKELGIKKIDIHAALSGGGYAWAKFGFLPDNYSRKDLVRELTYQVKRYATIPENEKAVLNAILEKGRNGDPTFIREIADHRFGKTLLRGTSWHGSFDLEDQESLERSYRYISKRKVNKEPEPSKVNMTRPIAFNMPLLPDPEPLNGRLEKDFMAAFNRVGFEEKKGRLTVNINELRDELPSWNEGQFKNILNILHMNGHIRPDKRASFLYTRKKSKNRK